MVMKFTNNATSTLASGINSSVTSLTVASGQGALFPTLGAGDYFYCTLANAVGTIEIVKVTARSTDTFTITRAQDGTTASAWSTGDKVELRLVSASLNDLPKLDETNTFSLRQTYSVGTVQGPWTTGTRPSSPVAGLIGFNTSFNRIEAYNATASAWVSSGGATGTGSDAVFYENGKTVNTSYTITSGNNAHSVGPITIASGQSVTIPTGSRWVVL
ncbi:hypothetical protein UFOVP135_24 [uncultured Caudovirales phage]|uniref:Uncharacterized protein n=1 Tax=uncultured Caudovirales phage TaxID=2100421 RepID=A0A6J5LCC3_9CAUD|nr:hypothetical protein UFOVP135_24 [uncultured Caudovirales phage]